MKERSAKKVSKKIGDEQMVFDPIADNIATSPVRNDDVIKQQTEPAFPVPAAAKATEPLRSPEFLELAEPKLPNLTKSGNRARLLMQSPNRLYFYWSVARNPFHTLNRALGESSGYSLVLKLVNTRTEAEEIHRVDESGNWWFDVDADSEYRAEIGFYAVNRPYIRVLFSNLVATPRRSPSPRPSESAEWRVPAERFARVLNAAGFARDAFDVALTGDDWNEADIATRSALAQFTGKAHSEFATIGSDEIRYAMLALASGISLNELRGLISDGLYRILSAIAGLTSEDALAALKERFDFDSDDLEIDEEVPAAVFGASVVNFPGKPKKARKKVPSLEPLSSHSLLRDQE